MLETRIDRHDFSTSENLVQNLVEQVITQLTIAIHEKGRANLCVSGAESLASFFHILSQMEIDWSRITIFIADELFMPLNEEQLRENFVKQHLLQNHAKEARFIGLFCMGKTADVSAFSASSRLSGFSKPFDVTILDVGIDGHIASLLPGGDRIMQGLNPKNPAAVLPMYANTAHVPRLTMSLSRLLQSHFIGLVFYGKNKLPLIELLQQPKLQDWRLPVQALVHYADFEIHLFFTEAPPVFENCLKEEASEA